MTSKEQLMWEILNAALYDITSGDKNDAVIAIEEVIDLLEAKNPLAQVMQMLDTVTTLIYNMEGDVYQQAYEKLEEVISQLQTKEKANDI
jgi:hypothetical protein